MIEPVETLPLPEDPVLATWAAALNDTGGWAYVLDAKWRWVFTTDDLRLTFGDTGASTVVPVGSHFWSPEASRFFAEIVGGPWTAREHRRALFSDVGRYVLASTPGDRDVTWQPRNISDFVSKRSNWP